MTTQIKNALIKDVRLEIEDHGILTAWLIIDYGHSTEQAFGGFALDKRNESEINEGNITGYSRIGSVFGTTFIRRCLEITEASEWSEMKGKNIRVKVNDSSDNIIEIGHIIKDIWFDPILLRQQLKLHSEIRNTEINDLINKFSFKEETITEKSDNIKKKYEEIQNKSDILKLINSIELYIIEINRKGKEGEICISSLISLLIYTKNILNKTLNKSNS